MSYLKQLRLHADLLYSQKAGIAEEIDYTEKRLARLRMDHVTVVQAIDTANKIIFDEKQIEQSAPVKSCWPEDKGQAAQMPLQEVNDTEGQTGSGC